MRMMRKKKSAIPQTTPSNDHDDVATRIAARVQRAIEVFIQQLDREDRNRHGRLLHDIAPGTLYQAGLTVMMRLMFLLCAEEQGLLMAGDTVYARHYAISTLREQLQNDAIVPNIDNARTSMYGEKVPAKQARVKNNKDAIIPSQNNRIYGEDVRQKRHDAWARILATFRAIHRGVHRDDLHIPALGGTLFDPDTYPFLEGREPGEMANDDIDADRLPIDDQTVLLLLDALQTTEDKDGVRPLCYRTLEVERLGDVYEGLLAHTVERAGDVMLGFAYTKGKNIHPDIALTELEASLRESEDEVKKKIAAHTGKRITESAWKKTFLVSDEDLRQKIAKICDDDTLTKRILPYAGFLRKNALGDPIVYPKGTYMVTSASFRSDTGTYYTPKSLTELVVQEALEPVAYVGPAEKKPRQDWRLKSPEELFSLRICDPAMGSGAFLVQVCRYLGERLCEAWELAIQAGKSVTVDGEVVDALGDKAPLPQTADEWQTLARQLVARQCIYGVDINPMAVELAKLSIWLVTKSKDKPLYFLDDSLKCGDSLMGSLMRSDSIEPARTSSMPPDAHWRIEFPQVMTRGGFDAIVGNPPYGVDMSKQEMAYYKRHFDCFEKRSDIYMCFYELGLQLTKRTLCYVTPDKWLSKTFGKSFREHFMKPYMTKVFQMGNDVFKNALVDTVVSVFDKKCDEGITILAKDDRGDIHEMNTIDRNTLSDPYMIDQYFTKQSLIVAELEKLNHSVSDYAHCEYGMIGPVAYQLKELIHESDNASKDEFKVITTGLIDKYIDKWDAKSMKYLGVKYMHPVVRKTDIMRTFGENFLHRVSSPKLMLKGLNLLDCCIDMDGAYMSTVATLNIRSQNINLLMILAAILNSSIAIQYIQSKYCTGGYCGGTLFTPDMINRLPVPPIALHDLSPWSDVMQSVREYLKAPTEALRTQIDNLVRKHYERPVETCSPHVSPAQGSGVASL